jgi:RHS repeat-associated protein
VWDRESGLPLLVDDGWNAYLHAKGVRTCHGVVTVPTRGCPWFGAGVSDSRERGRQSSGAATIFGFTGEQRDSTTGFTYLRARYLDPLLGRFTSADAVQPNAPGT